MKISVIPGRELSPEHVRRWAEIQEANPELASPYFRPEFTVAVASVRNDVRVGILEEAGEAIGFFPFQRNWMRIGRPVGGPLSDYQGVIIGRDAEWDAEDLIRGCGLVSWDFDHLIASQRPFQPYYRANASSPFMDLSKGYEAYKAERHSAGSRQISRLGNPLRRLERELGTLRFEVNVADAVPFQKLLSWKSQQYLNSGLVDVFSFPWVVMCLERIAATQGAGFVGTLCVLYVGDEVAAVHLSMRSRDVWHYWFPAYDRRLEKYSPGLILLLKTAEVAPELGIRMIDLGKGDALYKERLMSSAVPLAEGSVEVSSVFSAARRLRRGVETWVRRSPRVGLARVLGRWICRAERRSRFR